ncbi:MAG: Yip1 family protein [Verrucomicrobiota bacterium]
MTEENPYAPPQSAVVSQVTGEEPIEHLNPWKSIWGRPKATIRFILATDPGRAVLALAAFSGISQALDRAVMRSAGDVLDISVILGLAVVLGPISGIIGLYIGGALLRWTGSWLRGTAESGDIRAAIAWASVPVVCWMPLWIPQLLLFGKELFTTETPHLDESPVLLAALIGLGILEVIVGVWSFILLLHTIGQAHGFSAWKALGSIFLAFLTVALPLIILLGLAFAPFM